MAFNPKTPKEESRNCPQIRLPGLWELITLGSNVWLERGLKQTCSSPQELSNGVSHFTCTCRGRVDPRLLVVGSQIVNLTPGPSFNHNLCCKFPNGSCEAIFDIYTSRPFQQYKEHIKARCFDLCKWALKLQESRRTPSSHFWESEFHPHTCLKVGCDTFWRVIRNCLHIFKIDLIWKYMNVQSYGIVKVPILGLRLGSPKEKWHLNVILVERHRIYYREGNGASSQRLQAM